MEGCCQCKGVNFLGFMRAAERLYPEISVATLTQNSPEALRELIAGRTLLTGGWYPVTWYNSLHEGLRQATGRGFDVGWEIGFEATRLDFAEGGIYRHVARMLSPNTMFSLGQKIFGFYWKPGRLTTEKLGKKKAVGHWQQCDGFDEGTWQDILGSTVQILQLTGAHEPTLHVVAGGQDEPYMRVEATWL